MNVDVDVVLGVGDVDEDGCAAVSCGRRQFSDVCSQGTVAVVLVWCGLQCWWYRVCRWWLMLIMLVVLGVGSSVGGTGDVIDGDIIGGGGIAEGTWQLLDCCFELLVTSVAGCER